ncbi:hypothetical protein DFJ73DRAFT_665732 [Zopfochytrium polystomum]|nr:hypothetical protein DFJ73DRAFT_665732 [Zopfochytrium polystomum]
MDDGCASTSSFGDFFDDGDGDGDVDGSLFSANLFADLPTDALQRRLDALVKPDFLPAPLPQAAADLLSRWHQQQQHRHGQSQSASSHPITCALGPSDEQSFQDMMAHTWGEGHVECPERLTTILAALSPYFNRLQPVPGRRCTDAEILLAHTPRLLADFQTMERGDELAATTTLTNLSYANAAYAFRSVGPVVAAACRASVGSCLALTDALLLAGGAGSGPRAAFAVVRPAGHHSGRSFTGGFGGLNRVAIAAGHARAVHGVRVGIVDWDVHRSGGTEDIVAHMLGGDHGDGVCLADVYGALGNVGAEIDGCTRRAGNILSVAMEEGAGDVEYERVLRERVVPFLQGFGCEFIVVSAGFDCGDGEKEGFRVTPEGFRRMASILINMNGCKVLFALEGGYELDVLAECVKGCVEGALGREALGTIKP